MRFRYCLLTSRAVVGVLTAASGSVATRQRCMAESRNISCFWCLTDRTCAGFLTLFGACSRLCDYPAILISTTSRGPFMLTGSRNYFFLHITTFRASTGPFTCFATGSFCRYCPIAKIMSGFIVFSIIWAPRHCALMPMVRTIAFPSVTTVMHMSRSYRRVCGIGFIFVAVALPGLLAFALARLLLGGFCFRCHCRWHHGADHGKDQEQ